MSSVISSVDIHYPRHLYCSCFMAFFCLEYTVFTDRFDIAFIIKKEIEHRNVAKNCAINKTSESSAITLEDFSGVCLSEIIKNGLEIHYFLRISLQIVDGLNAIHAKKIIHRNLNPANILIDTENFFVKVIDFSQSSSIMECFSNFSLSNEPENSLAYVSPEQTGRINCGIDQRADLYSLGVLFFEMVTGKKPFEADDPLELVHCHLAKTPLAPKQINHQVPVLISDMILKLLAKNPEDRYQSCFGLKHDLEQCWREFDAGGYIKPFPLGTKDYYQHIRFPKKLIGRDKEIAAILEAFESVKDQKARMILISGLAGIGKTALIRQLGHIIARENAVFISGKFDQLKTEVPYSALSEAFGVWVRHLLVSGTDNINHWRRKLKEGFGKNLQVFVGIIPELEKIVGKQMPRGKIGLLEEQNRFKVLMQKFFRIISNSETPLVLFLDDLQWMDKQTSILLELCIRDVLLKNMLIIGAFRENEVGGNQLIRFFVEKAESKTSSISKIRLNSFGFETLKKYIMQCTCQKSDMAGSLAAFLLKRTEGNPFETREFIKWMEANELLKLEPETGVWIWESSRQTVSEIPSGIVDLLTKRFGNLSQDIKKVLSQASCIGNEFNDQLLHGVIDDPSVDLRKTLSMCVTENFIIPVRSALVKEQPVNEETEDNYRFVHDKIHDVAYALLSENQRMSVHLKIVESLLKQYDSTKIEQNIFDIVNHLNLSKGLIISSEHRVRYAQLCLVASRKAKNAGAFHSAFSYIKNAIAVSDTGSMQNRELMLALYTDGVKAAYLCGELEKMEKLADTVIKMSEKLLDQIEVFEVLIQAKIGEHKLVDAVDLAINVLKKLNIHLPQKPSTWHVITSLAKAFCLIKGRSPEKLLDLPKITDPEKIASSKILFHTCSAAYFSAPELFPILLSWMVQTSVRHGNSDFSSVGYAGLGLIITGVIGSVNLGYRYGQLGVKLVDEGSSQALKASIAFLFNHFICHWKMPIHQILPAFARTHQLSLESGNFVYGAYCAQAFSGYGLACGKPLGELRENMAFYSQSIEQMKQETSLHLNGIFYQTALNLSVPMDNPTVLRGEIYDENKMLPVYRKAGEKTAPCCLYFEKLFLCYLFGDFENAKQNAAICKQYLPGCIGTFYIPLLYFYESLALIALYPDTKESEKKAMIKQVHKNQKKIKKWAYYAPENHLHRVMLTDAEKFRVLGKIEKAMAKYDQAVKTAGDHGFVHEKALAQELAFKFYMSLSKKTIAKAYLAEALENYARWGAQNKVEDLLKKHSKVIAEFYNPGEKFSNIAKDRSSVKTYGSYKGEHGVSSQFLDVSTVIKASQAISGEVKLDKFLSRMMSIILENAGAQKGFFIRVINEQLKIEAFADIENICMDLLHPPPFEDFEKIPKSIIRYVARTAETVVMPSEQYANMFEKDEYIQSKKPASILCTPIRLKEKIFGVLYLENTVVSAAFSESRIGVLEILLSQAAISLENAKLFTRVNRLNEDLKKEANERKLIQFALEESKMRLKTILDSVQAGIILVDVQKQRIMDANPAALSLIGGEKSTVVGRPCYEFLCRDSHGHCPAKEEKNQGINIERVLVTMNGEKIPILNTIVPIMLDNRTHFLESFIDIKELKEAERERTMLLTRLQQSQKMEAIGTLAGGIAHDFNNILTSILGFTELSLDDIEKGTLLHENLEEVSKAGYRAKELVKQILTFARQSKSEKRAVPIASLIDETAKFLRSSIPSSIEIRKELNSDESVLADPTQIHQIIMNLCTNAVHAMQKHGGILTIRLNEVFFDENFVRRHSLANSGHFVQLAVSDTGCGMSREVQDRIFEPYFTTKETGMGTGLGLSVVRGIIAGCDGTIEVHSDMGKGTIFYVYLPVTEKHLQESPVFEHEVPSGNERILLVDDEPAVVKMTSQTLKRLGYRVTTTTSSIEALRLFKGAPGSFDLLITDITMPGLPGDKLAVEILKIRKNFPVILCTGYNQNVSDDTVKKMGISALKFKPLVKKDLAMTIRDVLRKK